MTDTAEDLRAPSDAVMRDIEVQGAMERPIPDILAEWRAAERRLAAAEPGSAEALEAEVVTDYLRQEYRDAHEAHRQ